MACCIFLICTTCRLLSVLHLSVLPQLSLVTSRGSPPVEEKLKQAIEYINKSKPEKAVEQLNTVIKEAPDNALAYCYRGIAFTELFKLNMALNDYHTAIKLNPNLVKAYLERGRLYLAKKEWKKALIDLTTAHKLDSNDAWIPHWRGIVYNETKEYSKALDDFELSAKLAPNSPAFSMPLLWVLVSCPDAKVRDGKKALELAQTIDLACMGRDHTCLELMAAAYAEQGKYKEAVEWQEKAIKLLAHRAFQKKRAEVRLNAFKHRKPLRYSTWDDWY